MNGHRPAQDTTHIFLRPIGSPPPLGTIALGGASVLLTGYQLAWLPADVAWPEHQAAVGPGGPARRTQPACVTARHEPVRSAGTAASPVTGHDACALSGPASSRRQLSAHWPSRSLSPRVECMFSTWLPKTQLATTPNRSP
jgi:hypothetical protein